MAPERFYGVDVADGLETIVEATPQPDGTLHLVAVTLDVSCAECGREPHTIVTWQGTFVRYIERHEPDCSQWP